MRTVLVILLKLILFIVAAAATSTETRTPPTTTSQSTITASSLIVSTTISSALTISDQTYTRYGVSSGNYYYKTVQVTVSRTGSYSFACSSNMIAYGYLYNNSFVASTPALNLLISNGDLGGTAQFEFTYYLTSDVTYILVATTYSTGVTGTFSILASGPAALTLTVIVIPRPTGTTIVTIQ
ncbi:unnamed protein product [Rotaria socialis]|uniref:Uncharacterized protein n=1 Tax=Rotaria socialis TaxID=392032 RepID=A0A821V380_9BILA|nr:unnamed protein product [Rotaria socialis]